MSKHMTPELIFNQVPLNDIFYEVSNLPTAAPPFNFSGKDLTRREVLKKIASHWKLKMSFVVDASGKPTACKGGRLIVFRSRRLRGSLRRGLRPVCDPLRVG